MVRKSGFFLFATLGILATSIGGWAIGCGGEGGSGATSTTTGGGGGTPCAAVEECDDQDPCTDDACETGSCTHAPNAVDLADPTAGDCQKLVCKDGAQVGAKDNTDLPDDNEDCTVDACSGGVGSHTPKNDGTTCVIGDKSGSCSEGVCVVQCTEAEPTCPDDRNPCTDDACDFASGQCVYSPLDGIPTPGAPDELDCKRNECVAGVDTTLVDDAELPDDGNECTDDVCDAGVASNQPTVLDTPCGANGELLCDGAGTCGECNDPLLHCPFNPPCELPTCDNHVCGIQAKASGDASPPQLAADCLVNVCDGAGGITSQNDDQDKPEDNNDCTLDLCTQGVPSHVNQPALASCALGQCDGAGVCKLAVGLGCLIDSDCAGGMCVDGFCCDSLCAGPCDTCSQAQGALVNGACTVAPAGSIGSPSCSPYFCGGGTSACASSCALNAECAAGTFCSAGQCVPAQGNGGSCVTTQDCASGFCVDGVCCNSACTGLCQACTAARTGGVDGTCAGNTQGSDPDNECAVATCKTGQCDGTGACQNSTLGAACGSSLACLGTLQTNQDTCDGNGSCTDNGITTCAPYICGGSSCKTSCVNDGDCSSGNFCTAGVCTGKLSNGQSCSAASQCNSANCVDGVCCGSSTCPSCQACNVNGAGSCAPLSAGTQDTTAPNVCQGSSACDGTGLCKAGNGSACGSGATCATGFCVDNFCCNSACSASCDACSIAAGGSANGTCSVATAGTQGSPSCAPYVCSGSSTGCPSGCVLDGDCASSDYCVAGSCTAKKAQGAVCSATNECATGFCADGFCCDSACSASCTACSAAKKGGGSDGTCGNILLNSDPDNECAASQCSTGACNGFGTCGNASLGSACGDLSSCSVGTQTLPDSCNGLGTCVDSGSIPCGLYPCSGLACASTCVTDNDCLAAGYCLGGVCVPDCVQDQDCLSGEYCDLTTNKCAAQLAQGTLCGGANECATGFCFDGVCCNTGCTALCQACTAAKKGGGPDGVCSNILGLDPDNECAQTECTTGVCANGVCGNQPPNFSCGDSASCSTNLQTNQDTCNGTGTCTDKGTVSCSGFGCNGTVCKASCATDVDCISGYYCNMPLQAVCLPKCNSDVDCASNQWCNPVNQHCQSKSGNGTICTGTNQCTSGFCADGVCCTSACGGFCQACTAAKKGSGSDGSCGNIVSIDPDNECPNNECVTGVCGGGLCTNSAFNTSCGDALSCASGTQTNQDTCNGTGTCTDKGTTSCNGYQCSGATCATTCASDAGCLGTHYCDGATSKCILRCFQDTDCSQFPTSQWCDTSINHCVAKSATGAACSAGNQCQNGQCFDNVCCANSCSATCKSCALAGLVGTCSNIPAYSPDPVASLTCVGVQACNGSGLCKSANGQACFAPSVCVSNVCTSSVCKGPAGSPCAANVDCQSASCNVGAGTCN